MHKTFAGSLFVLFVACGDMDIPDLNNPQEDTFLASPTRTTLAAAATGLLIGARANYADPNGYISMLGILGREIYILDVADTRFIVEMLESPELDPASPAFGGNFWNFPYANIHNAYNVLHAVDRVGGFSDAEREATRGFAKTIQALDFLVVVSTRDTQGAPIDVDRGLDQPLAPIESKANVLAHIATLLDEGDAHLAAGGAAFPFPLSTGFEGFDTPATFRKFNRALKARVEIYRENFQSAADAVAQSFLDVAKPLSYGVYHAYGSGSGDKLNGLNSPTLFVHPRVVADAEPGDRRALVCPKSGVTTDCRIAELPSPWVEVRGLVQRYVLTNYREGTAPAPIIRNEELILLRAEARYRIGMKTEAIADLDLVRELSGGLGKATVTDANFSQELFKQRRYSLLFEGGHSWIDARRLGLLGQLPNDSPPGFPAHYLHDFFPIPISEMDARK